MKPGVLKKLAGRLLFLTICLSSCMVLATACKKKDNFAVYMPATPNNTDSFHSATTARYLALGDSYTIGTSVEEKDRYPVQAVALLQQQGVPILPADIIATNGWTTANLIDGISKSGFTDSYDVVSLLIGVNNQYQGRSIDEYKAEFTSLVLRAIQFAKGKASHVIVLSIPDYSVTPFASGANRPKIAAEIDAFNAVNKAVATAYNVQYLYITDDSRAAASDLSLVASDGLHFSGKEYGVWVLKLAPMIKAIVH